MDSVLLDVLPGFGCSEAWQANGAAGPASPALSALLTPPSSPAPTVSSAPRKLFSLASSSEILLREPKGRSACLALEVAAAVPVARAK
mmetsp:Transcript_36500/g.90834  ORF Transcript_36500/g.90834 Transcript_36500/m.90834 type:complete len:88 (+) Transcript_36500:694-957(+)